MKYSTDTHTELSLTGDLASLFGYVVPCPSWHYWHELKQTLVYVWIIDGFFGTKKGEDFLNDIVARFKLTEPTSTLHRIRKIQTTTATHKLRDFQDLKSISKKIIKEKYNRVETMHGDYVFWVLKLYAEDLIREDNLISYRRLENFAFENFVDTTKDRSTLKAKCRSVYNWYSNRNWEIGRVRKKTKGEVMATRQEHARKNSKKIAEMTKRKILNCISGMFQSEYRKKDGSWNISKIAKDSETTRVSVYKYLQSTTNE